MRAKDDIYELMELFGQTVLYTCARIDRDSVPAGIYAYDLRDDCDGIPYEIAPLVYVNHYGTVLCKSPLNMNDNGYQTIGEDDYSFLGDEMTLIEFIAS